MSNKHYTLVDNIAVSPGISIIIPTINRYEDLRNTLKFLSKQAYKDFEVIIIDQTPEADFNIPDDLKCRIKYIRRNDIQSASAARNVGITKSAGQYLVFLDDDVIIEDPNFLNHYLESYSLYPAVPGVVGCVLENGQKITWRRHRLSKLKNVGWLFFPQNYGNYCLINTGRSCNLSVKRDIAIDIGGMDENYVKGAHREEADFCIRISKKYGQFLFSPDAKLVHIGNPMGGIRSWNDSFVVKAQHHFDGAIYFILKNIPLYQTPVHIFAIFFHFIFSKQLLKNPKYIAESLRRFYISIFNAKRMIKKGPKYLYITQNNKR